MSKQSSVCKIYYFPSLDGGGFKEVPTVEYVLPDDRCWQERLMDRIGELVLVMSVAGAVSLLFVQIVKWMGWWPM
jgi:NADPH:quinone reductase-like Zn-dependent oxidoreductase